MESHKPLFPPHPKSPTPPNPNLHPHRKPPCLPRTAHRARSTTTTAPRPLHIPHQRLPSPRSDV
ncbi:predicted protein [Plenodomus lingam JN3]|uniref:Predicted protein n=1 Tax=Leptosphaeria maculans (strain JN3 / isolate v23.1.3 / race Av1-4-5-6-7-8) TaxID=985895 RepID=E5ADH4_LEPMJ|nr:predicted protein [Plenodomus lingam JN3]CBY01263.1 predicted protein [Plenodomus lingam JN3]